MSTDTLHPTAPHSAPSARLTPTPGLLLGPYYPAQTPLHNTLSPWVDRPGDGAAVVLVGRVINRRGQAVPNALVELWQADEQGRYNHESAPEPAAAGTGFIGYCAQRSSSTGGYRVVTRKPGAYQEGGRRRAPHLHFQVTAASDRLVTQMFFPDEPLNHEDRWLRASSRPQQLVATPQGPSPEGWCLSWDIVLIRDQPVI
jgi:protocatechuate 3,4-dioxygenase, beta subunit